MSFQQKLKRVIRRLYYSTLLNPEWMGFHLNWLPTFKRCFNYRQQSLRIRWSRERRMRSRGCRGRSSRLRCTRRWLPGWPWRRRTRGWGSRRLGSTKQRCSSSRDLLPATFVWFLEAERRIHFKRLCSVKENVRKVCSDFLAVLQHKMKD